MSTWTVLKDLVKTKLPSKKYFYGSLKDGTTGNNGWKVDGHITDEENLTCIKIWNDCNLKNMGHYHDNYFKKDFLLLADVCEKFIDTCLKFYKLEPCYYFSSPGLSWNAMIKMTRIKLQNILDIDMYLFIKKGLSEEFLTVLKDIVKQITKT